MIMRVILPQELPARWNKPRSNLTLSLCHKQRVYAVAIYIPPLLYNTLLLHTISQTNRLCRPSIKVRWKQPLTSHTHAPKSLIAVSEIYYLDNRLTLFADQEVINILLANTLATLAFAITRWTQARLEQSFHCISRSHVFLAGRPQHPFTGPFCKIVR